MSSTILKTIQTQLNLYGYSAFMVLGNIGNALIVLVFSRQHRNACSIYLFNAAIVNILYLTFNGFIQIFPYNYTDATSGRALIVCKLYSYVPNVIGQIAKTLLVLACVDRFLITNYRATFRAFSTARQAKYLTVFSVILWTIVPIHVPIMVTINNGQCSKFGVYSSIFTIYLILFVGLIPPVLSGTFGYLTYRNIRQMHNRVQPIERIGTDTNLVIRRQDRDLLNLVIAEVSVYVVTAIPFPLIFLEMMITQYTLPNKSFQYIQNEVFIINLALFLLFINSAAPFYTYLIASKSFRRDVKRCIVHEYGKLTGTTSVRGISTIGQTVRRQETRV